MAKRPKARTQAIQDPIAALFVDVLVRLASLLPLAEQNKSSMAHDPEPREPATAEISIGVLFPDEDGFWDAQHPVQLGDYLALDDDASAHLRLQHADQVSPLVAAFESLLDAVGAACPAFHRSHLRLAVDAYRHKPGGEILHSACIFGMAIPQLYAMDMAERGSTFSALVRALAPLDAPKSWWFVEGDGCPIAAAGPVEAAAIHAALHAKTFGLRTWLRTEAPNAAQHARGLASPDAIAADVSRLLTKA